MMQNKYSDKTNVDLGFNLGWNNQIQPTYMNRIGSGSTCVCVCVCVRVRGGGGRLQRDVIFSSV